MTTIGNHTLAVRTTQWDESTPCIVIVRDGLADHRSPSLTAAQARELAMQLTLAAEEIEQ